MLGGGEIASSDLTLEREPSIAKYRLHLSFTVLQIREMGLGHVQHHRIEFIRPKDVPRPAVGRQGPRPEADRTEAHRSQLLLEANRAADPRGLAVVGRWLPSSGIRQKLRAMVNYAVPKPSDRMPGVDRIEHPQCAVEVASCKFGVLRKAAVVVSAQHQRAEQGSESNGGSRTRVSAVVPRPRSGASRSPNARYPR